MKNPANGAGSSEISLATNSGVNHTRNRDWMQDFRMACIGEGFIKIPEVIIADGRFHRFAVRGDTHGEKTGSYICHAGERPRGYCYDWRSGNEVRWTLHNIWNLSKTERKKVFAQIREEARRASIIAAAQHKAASKEAIKIWGQSSEASRWHPYLQRKAIKAHGIRELKGRLVIPFYTFNGLSTLQYINSIGEKRWLTGGKMQGAFFVIGPQFKTGDRVYIAEGFATGASVFECKGATTIVAGGAGNLMSVADLIWLYWPSADIVICADDDSEKPTNIGLIAAHKAAARIGARVASPGDFK
jgi:putative DNA primase/helicase